MAVCRLGVGGGVVEAVPVFGREAVAGRFAVVGDERLAVFVVEDCPAFAPLFSQVQGVLLPDSSASSCPFS